MPDPVPVPLPGAICPDDANALQVTTPPIVVRYAFAPLLGKTTSSIRARAAAGAGPAAPNNCVLCVLDPDDDGALEVLGAGGIRVDGGGIVVNSEDDDAVVLLSAGDIIANQIRVVGNVDDRGVGQLLPPFEQGGPPVPDPLADLLPADELTPPPAPAADPTPPIAGAVTLAPGVYDSINVPLGATLTLEDGVYVVTGDAGFRVRPGGRVLGGGATIYLACDGYPAPCDNESGSRFRLDDGGQFLASPPATGEYAGLSIFADRGNTRSNLLLGDVNLTGAVYTASSRLRVFSTSAVQIDSLLVVDRLQSVNLAPLEVNYDPSLPLPGVGRPVLIQ